MKHKLRKICKALIPVITMCIALFLIAIFLFPLKNKPDFSTLILDSEDKIIHCYLSSDDKWRFEIELEEINKDLEKAFLFKEDRYFYYHFGINPIAISRAFANNIIKGKRTSGASTITMQVARLLEPKPRTYKNKLIEMFRAIQLEIEYSKKEILQLYLSLVPYGGNIEGVKAAGLLFFEKEPDHLSLAELTTLSIVPNKPSSLALGKHNNRIFEERNKWLKKFKKAKIFDPADIEDALNEPIAIVRHSAPSYAPHFSRRVKNTFRDQNKIKTNLKLSSQDKVEKIVSAYVNRLYHRSIRNAAVMVINNKTMAVEAYVGSADFRNNEDGGQVDGIQATRSPGSTLKPFVYGLGFDKGLMTPKKMVLDVPINLAGYSPINYDGEFNGKVSVEYALSKSLNIPAVNSLNEYGVDEFIQKLEFAGFESLSKNKSDLGLSLILGGCGVKLEELVKLYAAFANSGVYNEFVWLYETGDSKILDGNPIISPSSAYMITNILTKLTRSDFPKNSLNSKNMPKIAWKTGTSYGRKDAWSIGFTSDYTIGVWVGNFSGEGVAELSGAEIATPLLIQLFNTLNYAPSSNWFLEPKDLDLRYVCSESGLPPNSKCDKQVLDYFIPTISSSSLCSHFKSVCVNELENEAYCTRCKPISNFKEVNFPNYAPELIAYFENRKIPYIKEPPHNPNCDRVFLDNILKISSPTDGLEYLIDRSDNDELELICQSPGDSEVLHWYLNNKFYKTCKPNDNIFFTPKPGLNSILCLDDKGRKAVAKFTVTFL